MPAPRGPRAPDSSLVSRLNATIQMRPANNLMRVDKYYRSADLLDRQARQYRRQANEEQLYVMLMRLVSLVVETIPQHSGFHREDPIYQALRKMCLFEVMPELERLKLSLDLKDRTSRLFEEEPWAPTKQPGTIRLAAGNVPEVHWRPHGGEAVGSGGAGPVDALDQRAHGAAPPLDPFLLPGAAAAAGLTSAGLTSAGSGAAAAPLPAIADLRLDLPRSLRLPAASAAARSRHAILPSWQQPAEAATRDAGPGSTQTGQRAGLYPALPADLAQLDQSTGPGSGPDQRPPDPLADAVLGLGPQEVGVEFVAGPTAPPRPGESCCTEPPPATQTVPAVGPATTGVAEVAKRQSVRDVHVSVALMDEFLRYATSNTRRGIESCGILAGTLSVDDAVFTITTLIVPKQEGTSDTVQALNEEEIFEAQDSRGLYPLGWIHTHPTQTCFLSSIDVHTHCGYQTMLDEAVAIVMAPRDPSKRVGIFRLTTPGGLKTVQRCDLRGFHTHPPTATGQPLYEFCKHVYLNPRVAFDVVDLR
ncbi:hypothetical protein ACKKBG_A18585 [Auxenochlorella protothecoides x Auxenochlorella symbiontica]